MLTTSEIKKHVDALLDSKLKLLWLLDHEPINNKQKKFIEGTKELLKKVNQMLRGFGVKFPN